MSKIIDAVIKKAIEQNALEEIMRERCICGAIEALRQHFTMPLKRFSQIKFNVPNYTMSIPHLKPSCRRTLQAVRDFLSAR